MKFLCPACERLSPLRNFRVDAGTLYVSCPHCKAESRSDAETATVVPPPPSAPRLVSSSMASNVVLLSNSAGEAVKAAALAAQNDPFAVPEGHCPKCLTPRVSESCRQCGLVFAQAKDADFYPSEWLTTAWTGLLSSWGDGAAHERVRTEAMVRGELAQVGRLYRLRTVLEKDDPFAKKGIDEVVRLALVPSTTPRPVVEPGPSRWKYFGIAILGVACLLLLGYMARMMLASPDDF